MKKIVTLLFLFFVFVIQTGCSKASTPIQESGTISFVDDDGVTINLDKPAERIITLYSAHTENIFYLGAGDKLIGDYKTCTYPPQAAFIDKYDYNGDPEAVIGANPDVVIIRPFIRKKVPDFVKALENAGITVISLYPDEFSDFDSYIGKLAQVVGKEQEAQILLENFHSEIENIKEITSKIENKQTIFFESTDTNIRTVTPNSMPGLAIEYAGGINIAADAEPIEKDSSIAAFGEERVLMNGDNIDVYVSQRGSMNSGASKQGVSERAGFQAIKALKNNRFYTINEKLISSPTFRYVKGIRQLARFLYPDEMNSIEEYKNDNLATRRDYANIIYNYLNTPVFVPSSSSYYKTQQQGHVFGLFEDVSWQDKDFDAIETVVETGYIEGFKENDKEYFKPDNNVTRDELAQTIFVIGNFSAKDNNTVINDLSESSHKRIVQILVDNGVFTLENGNFQPNKPVTNNEIINALELTEK